MNKEDTYKEKTLYNHLFFDNSEKMQWEIRNNKFWNGIEYLHKQYPEINILVERFVFKDPHVSFLAENVKITCDSAKVQALADELYHNYYCAVPLTLLSLEPQKKDAVIEDILRNDK